jgi:hypothetical protein
MLSGIDAGKEIVIDNTDLVEKHAAAKQERIKFETIFKQVKKVEDDCAAKIMQAMGDASIARTESGVVFKRTKVNVKAKVIEAYSFVKFSRKDLKEEQDDPWAPPVSTPIEQIDERLSNLERKISNE